MDKSVRCKIHLTVRHSAKHYRDKKQSSHCSNREGLREADPRTMMSLVFCPKLFFIP